MIGHSERRAHYRYTCVRLSRLELEHNMSRLELEHNHLFKLHYIIDMNNNIKLL